MYGLYMIPNKKIILEICDGLCYFVWFVYYWAGVARWSNILKAQCGNPGSNPAYIERESLVAI